MAYDLKLSHASLRLARATAAGAVVAEEGKILVAVLEGGEEKVKVAATAASTDKVIGWSMLADAQPGRTSSVEEVVVPSSGALTADLRNQALVTLKVRAVVKSSGQVLTVDETYAGAPANDSVKVDLATGALKFHTDEAGEAVVLTYLYDLTIAQSVQRFGERFINNRNLHTLHGQMELGCGFGELYTDQFDPSKDYASAAALTLGDNGIITKGGVGPVLAAEVVHVPSLDNPSLGIRYRFMP